MKCGDKRRTTSAPIQTGVGIAYHTVGYQPGSAWLFEQVYGSDGRPIIGAFVDRNGDNQIDNDDRYHKALAPNWTYGFGFNFNYKNWDLSSSFRGQLGGQVYNAGQTGGIFSNSEKTAELLVQLNNNIVALRSDVKVDSTTNSKILRLLERVSPDGNTLSVTTATA
jgi:hypothetical protein